MTSGPCTAPDPGAPNIPGYVVPEHRRRGELERAAAAAGQGQAPGAVRRPRRGDRGRGPRVAALAEKLQAPVVNTLLGKGAVDETTPLHLGMLGMHGTAYANKAVIDCDLIMAIGARWDDRITGKVSEFCTDAMRIHVDIDPAEFNKIVARRAAARRCAARDRRSAAARRALDSAAWLAQCNAWRKEFPLKYRKTRDESVHYT